MKKIKQAKCYNCQHAGPKFKIDGKTHLHCQHPKYKKEDFDNGKLSPWDTLMEFSEKCGEYERVEEEASDFLREC